MDTNQQGHGPVHVLINQVTFTLEHLTTTARSLKEHAAIPSEHAFCLEQSRPHTGRGSAERTAADNELVLLGDDESLELADGQRFWSVTRVKRAAVSVTINRKEYAFSDRHQTGRSLKEHAGIPLTDVLFLDRPHEDEVVPNDAHLHLKEGECFHSAPPANYGAPFDGRADTGFERVERLPQPDGWLYLIVHDYPLPAAYAPERVRLLVKLPPLFPDAAPDMFWVSPHVRTAAGSVPHGASSETVLEEQWQRFSWHLNPGAWNPGTSSLRDFMRCIRARFEQQN